MHSAISFAHPTPTKRLDSLPTPTQPSFAHTRLSHAVRLSFSPHLRAFLIFPFFQTSTHAYFSPHFVFSDSVLSVNSIFHPLLPLPSPLKLIRFSCCCRGWKYEPRRRRSHCVSDRVSWLGAHAQWILKKISRRKGTKARGRNEGWNRLKGKQQGVKENW